MGGKSNGGDNSNSNSDGNIRTFLRIRPSKQPSGFINVDEFDKSRLSFNVPVENRDGEFVNNTRTSHKFKFDGVLGEKATQEDVFAKIGKGAVINVLDGYNSTVFAYGQTGSGKTFTVTGGAERYVDRGIIPRALSLLFAEFKERSDQQFTCHVSYLEIYNEQGFDLLDPSHDSKKLEDLPKVSLMEDEDGNIHLRNLSVYLAANEEDALNYLFLGDTNRAISETAMNKASSRSHCIFTISVEGRKPGSEKVTRSKLHLVDLAGSERVHKTKTGGQTLVEAKHINVSLFFLEMVIVALHEKGAKGRQHIPYRNSMMTSVLRDSLGGNCKTVMIATVNAEAAQTDESISTCRFAQRVSTIKNNARINEDLDPSVLIRRLRSDCAALTDEVAFLKGEAGEGEELTSEEVGDLKQRCRTFVEDPDPNAQLSIGAYTLVKLKRCFSIFKAMVLDGTSRSTDGNGGSETANGYGPGDGRQAGVGSEGVNEAEHSSLQDALRQRDNEIAILVNMLKQGKCHACALTASASATTPPTPIPPGGRESEPRDPVIQRNQQQRDKREANSASVNTSRTGSVSAESHTSSEFNGGGNRDEGGGRGGAASSSSGSIMAPPADASILGNPQTAFSYFRERHPGNAALEENKTLLSEKYTRAKAMGERVNQARSTIQYLKSTIEQIRRERALDGLMGEEDESVNEGGGEGEAGEGLEEETRCKKAIEVEKRVYKDSFQELRELKLEIEHIQRLLEKSRIKMQTDFTSWYEPLVDAAAEPQASATLEGRMSSAPGGDGGSGNSGCLPAPHSSVRNQTISASTEGVGGVKGGGGRGGNGFETPSRRPRPPVNAWGTPPASENRRPPNRGRGAGGAVNGGEAGGSVPTLTGNQEADEDIMAFYRAKEELERRKNVAARHGGGL